MQAFVAQHPEYRFGQALMVLGVLDSISEDGAVRIADPFNEEPWVTLNRMRRRAAMLGFTPRR